MSESDEYKKVSKEEKGSTKVSKHVAQHKKNTSRFLKRLYINVAFSVIFMTGEIIGGVLSKSIAIFTDAFHIFTDILSFFIAIISLKITQRPATLKHTYGYYRAEVIGALLSIALIWGLTAWLFVEAIMRFITPEPVEGLIMLITALFGLAGNIFMGIVFINSEPEAVDEDAPEETENATDRDRSPEEKKKVKKSLNMRTALIHVIGDALQSAGVCIAGGIIYANPSYSIADPICTILFCIVVLSTTIHLLKECVNVLMESSPPDIDMEELSKSLSEIDDVTGVHDLHVWSLSSGKPALSCHLVSDSPTVTLDTATSLIKEKFNINHVTLQIETCDPDIEFVCENDLH